LKDNFNFKSNVMYPKPTKNKIRCLTLVCAFLYCSSAFAQSAELQIVTTDGGYAANQQFSMSWTIGQISTGTASGGSFILTQGFQQSFPMSIVLPVELLNFTATKLESKVELFWQTALEWNSAGFAIERSDNDISWESIGYVKGIGNSNVSLDYTFLDYEPLMGNNYYRLRQIDLDGQIEFSSVCHVLFTEKKPSKLIVYPNPNNGRFTLSVYNPAGDRAVVEVFTNMGNLVWEQSFARDEMAKFWKKDLYLNQRQMYYVVSRIGNEVSTQKVVVMANK
jgi:hypothetical protein